MLFKRVKLYFQNSKNAQDIACVGGRESFSGVHSTTTISLDMCQSNPISNLLSLLIAFCNLPTSPSNNSQHRHIKKYIKRISIMYTWDNYLVVHDMKNWLFIMIFENHAHMQ